MIKVDIPDKKPLVGFFPGFFGIGETYPLIKIAKCYKELGGEAIFFSHGGDYEYLAKDLGCEVIRVEPVVKKVTKYFEYFLQNDEDIIRIIKNEASSYNEAGIKALVHTSLFFGSLFAARVAKISLISSISGTVAPPYYKSGLATYPDIAENYFTLLIPKYIKNQYFNWINYSYKGPVTKKLNRLAKKLDIDIRFKCKRDSTLGDYTIICDYIDFLGVKPTKEFPSENYVGAILPDNWHKAEETQPDFDIEKHLTRPGRHILLTMGSLRRKEKEIFLRTLKILNETDYNVISAYTTILNEDELPDLNDNILLKKFITNIVLLNKKVDLAIIHGGRGTVYTAAYSGKPTIAIPVRSEQQSNVDCLVRHESAIRISLKFFKEQDLLNAIEKIFSNYETYLHNAQNLVNKMPKPEGDKNAARRIVEILEQINRANLLSK
jgi:UDP:flavonoid glycosyltransferase YjiC (YdhE family)